MAKPAQRSGNLPAEVPSFIGRRHELAEARRTLTGARLVSLVGPGGVGKTRLAVVSLPISGVDSRKAHGWWSWPTYGIRRWSPMR